VISSIDAITIPLNSGNVLAISSGVFMIMLTKQPRLSILCLYCHAKIHGILAGEAKAMISSKLGR